MNEFKILLIDDEEDQEELLKEAIENFNKKYFLNNVAKLLEIREEKEKSTLDLLSNKEEIYCKLKENHKLKENSNLIAKIDELFHFSVTCKAVKTPEEAIVSLYTDNIYALIIDLNLEPEDTRKDDENYSGNILLKNIINKEILPITVRTGFPEKVTKEANRNIIRICSKETPTLEEVIEELLNYYNTSIFSIFGSKGKVNKHLKDFFWNVLPTCFIDKEKELYDLDKETQEKVLIRYVSNWLNNKYMFNDGYVDVEPMEMYMFPNPIEKICNCDIYEDRDTKEKLIVLTPSCDLANDKAENILFAKIQNLETIEDFNQAIQKCLKTSNNKKLKDNIALWFRNSHKMSMKYHFLPKVSFFGGGFINFSLLECLKYDKEQAKFIGRNLVKIGTITDSFKRDIIARFSAYYQRQGQPTFNTESILNKHA